MTEQDFRNYAYVQFLSAFITQQELQGNVEVLIKEMEDAE